MKLKSAAERIRRDSLNAYFKRINWRFMDDRVQREFEILNADTHSADIFGSLYISRSKDDEPIKSSNLISSQYINSTHIFTGLRLLGFNISSSDNESLEVAFERNAQLWYSQGPSGDVLVFVAPYQSNAGKINETEIIIGKYQNPSQITPKHIKKHFSIYFRYCTSTAQHSASNMSNYIYRQYLIFNDFRFKSTYRHKVIKTVERFLVLILAGAAIWASLYAGGKL
ncbi:TPA: hypothetical protein OGO53_004123 [Escherichia coli]|nr:MULTISPECIES: hypothetical protein [Escherichia]WGA35776.1 hypothetical protein NFK94_13360 [Escherichia fergusonii]HCQ0223373.1 hypothetical protein [Escherichia coli]